ncbi:MAG: hypothetical protein V1702_05595 [Candidatus Woesearchaeota archaeon]
MENYISLEMVERNEHLLIGRIFTQLQLNILKKRLRKKVLNGNERTYYYKFIKPKVKAMMAVFGISEVTVKGREFFEENRLEAAVKILRKLEQRHKGKKIIISGSFLFSKEYNDIDAFVFSKYGKEDYQRGKVHVTFLPESALDSLFFASISQISVSNFNYAAKGGFTVKLEDALQVYELLVNAILNKEDYGRNLRDFVLQTEYVSKGVMLNPKQLHEICEKLLHKNIAVLSSMLISTLALGYTRGILKAKLEAQIGDYKKLSEEYKNARNLPVYIDTYSKVIGLAA